MDNNIVVMFTDNNARVLRNPINLEYLKTLDNVLVNPNLSKVTGIPPHLWAKEGDSIRAMSEEESIERHKHHEVHGVLNDIHKPFVPEQVIVERVVVQEPIKSKIYQACIVGFVIGASVASALFLVFGR